MSLFLIPLVPLISAMLLLDYQSRETRLVTARYISVLSGMISLFLVIHLSLSITSGGYREHLFSPLFNLPGMPETLTLSLYADVIGARWLILMTTASFLLYLIDFVYRKNHEMVQLPAMHLAQAGLCILFLSGSLPATAIGWAIALIAVLFATNDNENSSDSSLSSSFTVLMVSVFVLVAASLLLYAITGRLAYSNHPDLYKALISKMIELAPDKATINVVTLASSFLLFAAMPGLALVPFSFWLSRTREMHPLNALFIYVNILPAAIIILERHSWLFAFTPVTRSFAITAAAISIAIAYIAIFTQAGTRLTMLWLAITCSALLLIATMVPNLLSVALVLVAIYPGLFVFGFGRILEFVYKKHIGRLIQGFGILLPTVTVLASIFLFSEINIAGVIVILFMYLLPAIRIFRSSSATLTDDAAFSSSLGWSAYRFFGIQTMTYYLIIRPFEYLSEGFLVLESSKNFFLNHTISRAVCFCGQLLNYFDNGIIDGSVRWLKKKHLPDYSDINRTNHGFWFLFLGVSILKALFEGRLL